MIAEVGHALLWLAAACALLQVAGGLVPRLRIGGLTITAAALQAWLWLWIGGCLVWLFQTTDLSVAGVAATTDAATPGPLKLLAIVVQDGGWLIAAAALAAWAGGVLAFARPRRRLLGAAGVLGFGLSALLLLHVEPFARLSPAPTEGSGFPTAPRAWLAGAGGSAAGPAFTLGETRGDTVLVAVTPLAGPDSTGVVGEIRIDGTPLFPEWRETIRPQAAFPVAAHGLGSGGWLTATLTPAEAGRWRVGVIRRGWVWLLPFVGVAAAGGWAWRRR